LLSVRRARAVQRFTGELSSPQVPDFWPHDNNPENSAIAARRWLGLTDDEQTAGREPRDLFNLLIHKLDNQGIEVLVHRFPRDDAKAYCLAEPQQIIVISANDPTVGSRNFSLMHELCHLSRGVSGLCITQDIQTSIGEERTCDKFAANLLMPETLIRSVVGGLRGVELTDSIDALAERVKCSKEALLIRFKELNLISGEELQDKLRELRQRTLPRGRGSSSRTSNLIKDCGLALPNLVFSAYRNEIVGPYEAAKILNINQARLDEVGSRLGYL
jgi:Zn-dependent peptidase ImmA (M78 family)